MITLELDEEQIATLRRVVDILLANYVQDKTQEKHLKEILSKLSVK